MKSIKPSAVAWIASVACVLFCASSASAQPAAIEQHVEEVKVDAFQADVTTLTANIGAAFNTGNTEAWQINTGSDFGLVRDRHGLGIGMAFAYGRANVATDTSDAMVDTVRNLKARARYDFFLTPMDALFLAGVYRWDTFAGLDTRVQGQLGYMRNFFKEEKHRFWGELGYDITYDNYDPDPLLDPDTMAVLPGDDVVHSVRAFLGYDNQINEQVTYLTGFEGLLNVEDTDDLRLAWDNALRSSIGGGFQLELKFSLAADLQPVAGTKKLDTTTLVNLLYTML
jgi:putative salt-induced outer membrane protein YdiY